MKQKQEQSTQQSLFAKQSMKQALMILTLPIMELSNYLQQEMEQNPLFNWDEPLGESLNESEPREDLEFSDNDFTYLNHWAEEEYLLDEPLKQETKIVPFIETCFEDLLRQFKEYTEDEKLIEAGRDILGNLNTRGLLETVKSGKIYSQALAIVKNLSPKGLGSKTLQEAFLEQLKGDASGIAYQMVNDFWNELEEGNFKKISAKTELTKDEILHILRNSLILPYLENDRNLVVPTPQWDLEIVGESDSFQVKINEEAMQKFSLNLQYYQENSSFIKKMRSQVAWVLKNIQTRNELLTRLGKELLKSNVGFFKGEGALKALHVAKIAEILSIHPSTLYRVIKDKWISSSKGLLPLKDFFHSTTQVEEALLKIIQQEDPKHPYNDEELVHFLEKEGHKLSRRGVAKYRKELNIPSSRKR